MKENKDGNDIFDMVDKAVDFYKENQDMIKGMVDGEDTIRMDDQSPLKTAIVQEDQVIISVEVKDADFSNVKIDDVDDGVVVGMNGEQVKAEVPEDVDVGDASATLNNGVLEVKIPRKEGEE